MPSPSFYAARPKHFMFTTNIIPAARLSYTGLMVIGPARME